MDWNKLRKTVFNRHSFRKRKDHNNSRIESENQDDIDKDKLENNQRDTNESEVLKELHTKIKIEVTDENKLESYKGSITDDNSLISSPQGINDTIRIESNVRKVNNPVHEVDKARNRPYSVTKQLEDVIIKTNLLEDEVFEKHTLRFSFTDNEEPLENFTKKSNQAINEYQPNASNTKLFVEKYRSRASSDSNLRRMIVRKSFLESKDDTRLSLSPKTDTEKSVTFSPLPRLRRRGRCRSQFKSAPHIKVKYTKVFGPEDGAYKNDTTPRGHVFMYNFSKFENDIYPERQGSETDYTNLLSLLQQMGYGTPASLFRYCKTGFITKEEFMKDLRSFSESRFLLLSSSCIIVIMSHGSGSKTFLTSDNQEVDLMDVYTRLNNHNCANLMGKPKIFILQFCRNFQSSLESPRSRLGSQNTPINFQSKDMQTLIENEVKKQIESLFTTQNIIKTQKTFQLEEDLILDRTDEGPSLLKQCINQKLISSIDCLSLSPQSQSRKTSNASIIEKKNEKRSTQSISSITTDQDSSHKGSLSMLPHNQSSSSLTSLLEYKEENEKIHSIQHYQTDTRAIATPPQDTEGFQRFSDMYSIFSTSSGELSYRDTVKGSLLVQAICHIFAEFAYQDDIDTLVRKVSSYIAKTLQKDDPITVPRQTCERTNNGLDKLFYFNPEEPPCCQSETL